MPWVRRAAVAVESVGQRLAGDVLHDQERHPLNLIDRVDRDDVLVLEGRGGLGFAEEPAASIVIGGGHGREYLDGDRALQCWVEGLEHYAHAAATDLTANLVGPEPAERAR